MTKNWMKSAAVRAVKTMAQTAVGVIGTGAVGLVDVDWMNLISISMVAGIVSILTSLGGLPEVQE